MKDTVAQSFRAMLRRINKTQREDSDIALRHASNQCYLQYLDDEKQFRRFSDRAHKRLRTHLPADMTVKMLRKPLEPSARLLSALQKPLRRITEKLFLH